MVNRTELGTFQHSVQSIQHRIVSRKVGILSEVVGRPSVGWPDLLAFRGRKLSLLTIVQEGRGNACFRERHKCWDCHARHAFERLSLNRFGLLFDHAV